MVTIGTKQIPNSITELTVEQFDQINALEQNLEYDKIEKWIRKFVMLGADEEEVNHMSFDEFKDAVKRFNDTSPKAEKITTFELDGYTYEASPIGVKELSMIEKAWTKSNDHFASVCMAIIFKRTDLGKIEHYDQSHIRHKTKAFKSLTANHATPYVLDVVEQLTKTAEKLADDATTELG